MRAIKPAALALLAALLLCFVVQSGTASPASSATPAQSQDVSPQTNGRGAIGINCISEANGCRIRRITKSGPAERAGLRVGDLLLPLNPADPASVTEQLAKNAPGTKITLPFQRGSEHMQIAVTVEDQLAIALRGAALGDSTAEEALGSIYRNGLGMPKNSAEALKWLRKAAEQGYDVAQVQIGWMYANGEGVPKDDRTAAEWYRKAADQGQPNAQYAMGWLYEHGEGVAKDDQVAVEWYRKATEQGHALAEYRLGQMYSEGRGVSKDDQAAAEWFRKAAEQGNVLGEMNLGWSYENGRGVPKDLATAIAWYKKAAAQGFEPAKQRLASLHQ